MSIQLLKKKIVWNLESLQKINNNNENDNKNLKCDVLINTKREKKI